MPDISRLQDGFRAFRTAYFEHKPEIYGELTRHGQKPKFLIIACSDSRIDPAILFGAEPGEMFVIRNIAGLVPPYQPDGMCHGTSAAMEFAVRDLKVERVIVLGHSSCGGIASLCGTEHGTPRTGISSCPRWRWPPQRRESATATRANSNKPRSVDPL